MFAHIYRSGVADDPLTIVEAPRVTELEDGLRFGYPGQRILVLGVLPRMQVIPMSEIKWFSVEEN